MIAPRPGHPNEGGDPGPQATPHEALDSRFRGNDGLEKWLRTATDRLGPISDTPRLDAELLAAHALGIERSDMLLRLRALAVPAATDALLARRLAHEPVAYILGWRDFWTLRLHVAPGVLIPRPDSETLIEGAIAHFDGTDGPRRILDLGTGSGALLLAALSIWQDATGIGIDCSPDALAIARANAEGCGLADQADIREGDWGTGLAERFDLILCNPPYIAKDAMLAPDVAGHEPHGALFAGPDGLDCYRILARQLPGLIASGGAAMIEIGHDQAESAGALFAAQGLGVSLRHDLGNRPRCLVLTP